MSMRVAFLVGHRPSSASVLHAIVAGMRKAGGDANVYESPYEPALLRADVVALRGLDLAALAAARWLEQAGVRCCNTVAATTLARDKAATEQALRAADVPRPRTVTVPRWNDVRSLASAGPVVVKPYAGSRGAGVVDGDSLPEREPFTGPFVVQERVDGDGLDRKLYVVGETVRGVLRTWPPRTLADKRGTAFVPSDDERELALLTGRALGLELFGVDVLYGAAGPVVVDVNAFPGYKGVPDAASLLLHYLTSSAAQLGVACAS